MRSTTNGSQTSLYRANWRQVRVSSDPSETRAEENVVGNVRARGTGTAKRMPGMPLNVKTINRNAKGIRLERRHLNDRGKK